MKNNEELQTLIDQVLNLSKNLQHVAQRLTAFLTKDEIVLERISNKRFCDIIGIDRKTAERWREEGKIKFEKRRNRITYLLKDVYAFYEKRNGMMKAKVIVANRL